MLPRGGGLGQRLPLFLLRAAKPPRAFCATEEARPWPAEVRASSEALWRRLRAGGASVKPGFLSEEEEALLARELEPQLRRHRYEDEHWDGTKLLRPLDHSGCHPLDLFNSIMFLTTTAQNGTEYSRFGRTIVLHGGITMLAIHKYRETEKSSWSKECHEILQRVRNVAFTPGVPQLTQVHVLDLDKTGYIKPHIDSIKFCGCTIAGLSLLSPSVMRLVGEQNPQDWLDLLLERRSLYILRGPARYEFTHEILKHEESYFDGRKVPRERRISVICRNLPLSSDPS